jgi:hypothetical protein
MAEIISCPSCQRKLQVPEALVGQDVQCPTCGATFKAVLAAPKNLPDPPAAPSVRQRERELESDDDSASYDDDFSPGEPRRYRRRDVAPHRGTLILVFGILGLVIYPCLTILAPVAWIMGNADIKEIRAGRMDPEGEGTTQAGRILGIIGSVVLMLSIAGILMACCAGGMNRGGRF